MRNLGDVELRDRVALVRSDLNVPMADGAITDATRIDASLDTLRAVLEAGGGAVVMSHLGRPAEGAADESKSLAPVAAAMSERLGTEVRLASLDEASRPGPGGVLLLENTRFNSGEKANDPALAARYAALGDVFVMDAFASAHREEASTCALAAAAGERCAGLLLAREVEALGKAMEDPARPLLAVVGGAKVSTKLTVLDRVAALADRLVVGGGIANSFLLAKGMEIGKSLAEPSMADTCRRLLKDHGRKLVVPRDVVVAPSVDSQDTSVRACDQVRPGDCIGDVGPETVKAVLSEVEGAGTVIWNGALGVFENDSLSGGTKALAAAVADSDAFTIAGGGETVAAAKLYGVAGDISWLSTGGGAFLEFVEGKELPGLAALG